MRRRAWGCIVWRDGKAYGKVRLGGTRTMRLLRHDDEDGTPVTDALDAEPAMERLRQELAAARDIRAGVRAHLGEWLDIEYSAILAARLKSEHSALQAEAYLVRFAGWLDERHGARTMMDALTRADVDVWCAEFLADGYKASYLRRIVNALRRAWNDALVRGFVDENPWSSPPIPRIPDTYVPWVEPKDLRAICAAVTEFQRPLVTLIAETGLAVGEALGLRREDVDLRRGVLHVREGKTPYRPRTVPLTARAAAAVRSLPSRKDGRLLAPRSSQGVCVAIGNACDHLKLPPVTTHQLRHVYGSHLVVAGTPPTVVASLLGHANAKMVLTLYGRWYPPDAQSRATEALAAFRSRRGPGRASRATPGRPGAPAVRGRGARRGPSAS